MSELIDRAIAHITEQMMQHPGDDMYIILEEYLTEICTTNAIADKLLKEEKNLEGFIETLWEEAKKRNENTAVMTSSEVIPMLELYYGITEEDKQGSNSIIKTIDITDFL